MLTLCNLLGDDPLDDNVPHPAIQLVVLSTGYEILVLKVERGKHAGWLIEVKLIWLLSLIRAISFNKVS